MKAKVSTYNRIAAEEFESFLREWEVEFDFNENRAGKYTYTFDDQNDRQAFQTEGLKTLGANLWMHLEWN